MEHTERPVTKQRRDDLDEDEDEDDDYDIIKDCLNSLQKVRLIEPNKRWILQDECHTLAESIKLPAPILDFLCNNRKYSTCLSYKHIYQILKCFKDARKLLLICRDGSKLYLIAEREIVLASVHRVYQKLYQAMEGIYDEQIGLSRELRIHINRSLEILKLKSEKTRERNTRERRESTLEAIDLKFILENKNNQEGNSMLCKFASILELESELELFDEGNAIRKQIEKRITLKENLKQSIDLFILLQKRAQVEIINEDDPWNIPLTRKARFEIPPEFKCPISHDIMRDPVSIQTGQAFERIYIERYFRDGNRRCPCTRETLTSLELRPCYNLKSLIKGWCDEHKVEIKELDPLLVEELQQRPREERAPPFVLRIDQNSAVQIFSLLLLLLFGFYQTYFR